MSMTAISDLEELKAHYRSLWLRANALLESAAEFDVDGMTPVSVDCFDSLAHEVEDMEQARPDLCRHPDDT